MMLPRSPSFQIEFSRPIVLRDGARLATTDHAQMFLSKLAPGQITAPINYARIVLGIARRTGKGKDVDAARAELVRAFRGAGLL
jgi:hypothetical protein